MRTAHAAEMETIKTQTKKFFEKKENEYQEKENNWTNEKNQLQTNLNEFEEKLKHFQAENTSKENLLAEVSDSSSYFAS